MTLGRPGFGSFLSFWPSVLCGAAGFNQSLNFTVMVSLNCYIGGRKCAVAMSDDSIVLFSHSAKWDDGTRFANMLGWKFARRFSVVGFPGSLAEAAGRVASRLGLPYCCEGSYEFDQIRANIRKVTKHSRRSVVRSVPAEPVPVEPAVVVPVPEPVPVPVPVKSDEIKHAIFDDVCAMVRESVPVYLWGPAGSGKNHICEQIARELGLDFYYTNTVTQEYKLTGFMDAGGRYVETDFYRAFKNGGLFMLDEMDASCPDALIVLNSALANRYFAFPCGTVKAHPDFRVIAAGNTLGTGATEQYNGRTKIDAATLDRFLVEFMDYDPRVEVKLAAGNTEVLSFIRDLRRASKQTGVNVVLGYRAISKAVKFAKVFSPAKIIDTCICGFVQQDERRVLYGALSDKSNKYAAALVA